MVSFFYLPIPNLNCEHFISATCKHIFPAVQTVTSPQFHKMRLRIVVFLVLCVVYCAIAISVPLEQFKVDDVTTDRPQLGNIIKVGCPSGYVKFRGKCRKKWCK